MIIIMIKLKEVEAPEGKVRGRMAAKCTSTSDATEEEVRLKERVLDKLAEIGNELAVDGANVSIREFAEEQSNERRG